MGAGGEAGASDSRSYAIDATDAVDAGEDVGFRSGAVVLREYGLLKVHGADAATFLQAQLTSDVAALADGEVRLAGYCSVKGRLTASFWVWRDTAAQTFWLACSRDIAAPIAKRLSMFVLRAKAKVEDASEAVALLGLLRVEGDERAPPTGSASDLALPAVVVSGPLAAALRPAGLGKTAHFAAHATGDAAAPVRIHRALRPVAAATLEETVQGLARAGTSVLPMSAWRRLEVLSGIARIEAGNQELFVPQMVNFELVDGVNFRKGCYPGQEVVARSQYLGKLKRRMFLGLGAGEPPSSGSDVHGADSGEPVGQVVLAAPLGDGSRFVALFESVISAVPPETYVGQAGAPDEPAPALRIGPSPITRLPLPYPLPSPTPGPAAPAARAPDVGT